MPTGTDLVAAGSGTDSTTYNPDLSAAAEDVVLLWVDSQDSDQSSAPSISVDGGGYTWTEAAAIEPAGSFWGWWFIGVGVPDASTVTITFGLTQNRCSWSASEWVDVDTSSGAASAIVQGVGASGSGTTGSVTLSSFADAVNNATVIGIVKGVRLNPFSPDGSLTELNASVTDGENLITSSAWLSGEDTTPSYSWSTSANWRAAALELAHAAGGTPATAEPAVIAASVALPASTALAGAMPTPAAVAAPVALPAATVETAAGATAEPAAIAATTTLPAASALAGAISEPTAIAAPVTLPASTPAAGAVPSPAALAAPASIPQAAPSAGAIAAPTAIGLTVTLPQVTPTGAATASPAAIDVAVTLPQAFANVGDSAIAEPAAIVCTATLPGATATGGATAEPGAITATVTLPAPSPAAGALVSTSPIDVTVTLPTAIFASGAIASPEAIAASVALAAVTVSAGALATPDVIDVVVTLPEVSIDSGAVQYKPQIVSVQMRRTVAGSFSAQVVRSSIDKTMEA